MPMKKWIAVLVAALLTALLLAVPVGASGVAEETGEVLVKFKANTPENEKAAVNRSQNATKRAEIKALGVQVLKVKNPKAIAALLKNNKHVEYAEQNIEGALELAPDDPNYSGRLGTVSKTINAEAGWEIITASDVLIAVVDSGLAAHGDLGTTVAGYSPFDASTNTADVYGHGTQVAGVAGAKGNNGLGTVGINWDARIMPIKVAGSSSSVKVSDVAAALVYAADNGAKIINMSLSFPTDSQTLREAADYAAGKGCLMVAAAGNGGSAKVNYPAAYSNVLAVGGAGTSARHASSNYGEGLGVMGVYTYYTLTKSGSYGNVAGTSIATPQVAALASLVWKLAPDLSAGQVTELICQNARDVGPAGYDTETGYGIIDMGATLKAALEAGGGELPKEDASSQSQSAPDSSMAESLPPDSSLPDSSLIEEPVPAEPEEPTAPPEPQYVTQREELNLSGTIGKKQGGASHALTANAAGDIDVSISFGGKKNKVAATLADASGNVVASGEGSSSYSIQAKGVAAGAYTLSLEEKSGANNVSYTAKVLMPEVTYEIIGDEKVPLGTLEKTGDSTLALVVLCLMMVAVAGVFLLLHHRAKRAAGKE